MLSSSDRRCHLVVSRHPRFLPFFSVSFRRQNYSLTSFLLFSSFFDSSMTTPSHSINQATANSSWSRSPPPYSEIQNQTGPSQANGLGGLNGNGDSSTPVPVHSRKGSLMVGGGGVDIQKGEFTQLVSRSWRPGNLAFGTVDSPHPLLSSSPAAPSLTGAHLSDNVKSFGSIDADSSTDTSAVKASRRSSTLSPPLTSPPPNAGQKLLDMHALFGAKPKPNGTPAPNVSPAMASVSPIHERRLSNSGFQSPNGSAHLRPPHPNVPGQSRSSVSGQIGPNAYVNGPIPAQMSQGFRPPQMRPGPLQVYQPGVRPHLQQQAYQPGTGMPTMGHSGPQGPYQMMGYPHQQYYVSFIAFSRISVVELSVSRMATTLSNLRILSLVREGHHSGRPNNILKTPNSTLQSLQEVPRYSLVPPPHILHLPLILLICRATAEVLHQPLLAVHLASWATNQLHLMPRCLLFSLVQVPRLHHELGRRLVTAHSRHSGCQEERHPLHRGHPK